MADPYAGIARVVSEDDSDDPYAGIASVVQDDPYAGIASPVSAQPQIDKIKAQSTTTLGTLGRSTGISAVPTAAGLGAGVIAGTALTGMATGSFGGPVGALIGGLGGIAVGMIASTGAAKLQDVGLESVMGEEDFNKLQDKLSKGREEHPYASFAGEILPALATAKPSPTQAKQALTFAKTMWKMKSSAPEEFLAFKTGVGKDEAIRVLKSLNGDIGKAEQVITASNPASKLITKAYNNNVNNMINVGLGAGTQTGMEAYNQIKEGKFEPVRLIGSLIAGAILNKSWGGHDIPEFRGLEVSPAEFAKTPSGSVEAPVAAEGAAKVEAVAGERIATPEAAQARETVVSTAIKDADGVKQAPSETPFAPHEELKSGAPDSERVFVTDKGRVVDRSEAARLMPEVSTEAEPGKLHSEDLRREAVNAGPDGIPLGKATIDTTKLQENLDAGMSMKDAREAARVPAPEPTPVGEAFDPEIALSIRMEEAKAKEALAEKDVTTQTRNIDPIHEEVKAVGGILPYVEVKGESLAGSSGTRLKDEVGGIDDRFKHKPGGKLDGKKLDQMVIHLQEMGLLKPNEGERELMAMLTETSALKQSESAHYDEMAKSEADWVANRSEAIHPGELKQGAKIRIKNEEFEVLNEAGGDIPAEVQNTRTGEVMELPSDRGYVRVDKGSISRPVGIKNASTDYIRANRQYGDRTKDGRSFEAVASEAQKIDEVNPSARPQLVEDLVKEFETSGKTRPLTDLEDVQISRSVQEAYDSVEKAQVDIAAARKAGDKVAELNALANMDVMDKQLLDLVKISEAAGTANARGLAARRWLVGDRYTQVRMRARLEAVNEGKPLSKEQVAWVEGIVKEMDALKARLVEKETVQAAGKEKAARAADEEAYKQKFIDEIVGPDVEPIKETPIEPIKAAEPTVLEKVIKSMQPAVDAAKARIKAATSGKAMEFTQLLVETPGLLRDYAIVGSQYIAKGANTIAKFTKQMTDDFGPGIKSKIKEIWNQARKIHDGMVKSPDKPDEVIAEATSARGRMKERVKEAKEKIQKKIDEIKEQISEKERKEKEAKERPLQPDQELMRMREEEKAYQNLLDKYLPEGPESFADEKALSKREDQLNKEISDLNDQINAKQRKAKKPSPADTEFITKLKAIRDAKRMLLNEMFPKTPEERLKIAEKTATLRLENLKKQHEAAKKGEFEAKGASKKLTSDKLVDIERQIKEVKQDIADLQEAAQPGVKAAEKLAQKKQRMLDSIAETKKKIEAEDYSKSERDVVELDAEGKKIENELAEIRKKFDEGVRRIRTDPEKWMKNINEWLEMSKVKMTPEELAKVESDLKAAARITDKTARDTAVIAALRPVAEQAPFTWRDFIEPYVYTNMLSGPQSHQRNIYGNAFVASIVRPLALLANRDFRGLKTYMAQSWDNLVSGKAWAAALEGYRRPEYGRWMEMGVRPDSSLLDAIRLDVGPKKPGQKRLMDVLTAIPKLLNAQDNFFASMIEAGEVGRLVESKKYTPEQSLAQAKKLSERLLFRKQLGGFIDKSTPHVNQALDWLANMIDKGRRSESSVISIPFQLFFRFVRTPFRIAQLSVDASPLAYFGKKMTVENISEGRYRKTYENLTADEKADVHHELETRRGLAAMGTAITIMGAGAALMGQTTWGPPQDAEAKKRFYASGRRPYSVKIGDTWVPMMYLGPLFVAYALPAAAADAFRDNPKMADESWLTKLGTAAAGIPKIILSQTPMSGFNGLLEASQGKLDRTVAASFGFQSTQFIPGSGLLRWMNKVVDPTYRKPITIDETIKAGIPGLSQDVQAYKDQYGMDAQRPWTDIYLPYTLGEIDEGQEKLFQRRQGVLATKQKYSSAVNKAKKEIQERRRDQK